MAPGDNESGAPAISDILILSVNQEAEGSATLSHLPHVAPLERTEVQVSCLSLESLLCPPIRGQKGSLPWLALCSCYF